MARLCDLPAGLDAFEHTHDVGFLHDEEFLAIDSVPDHLPNNTRSPALRSMGMSLPASSRAPGPTATTSPSCGFSWAVSGIIMPPFVFSSPSRRRMTTRSCSGLNFMGFPLGIGVSSEWSGYWHSWKRSAGPILGRGRVRKQDSSLYRSDDRDAEFLARRRESLDGLFRAVRRCGS